MGYFSIFLCSTNCRKWYGSLISIMDHTFHTTKWTWEYSTKPRKWFPSITKDSKGKIPWNSCNQPLRLSLHNECTLTREDKVKANKETKKHKFLCSHQHYFHSHEHKSHRQTQVNNFSKILRGQFIRPFLLVLLPSSSVSELSSLGLKVKYNSQLLLNLTSRKI